MKRNTTNGIGRRNALARISRMMLVGAAMIGLSGSLAMTGTAFGKTKQIKFTNNSSKDATDLHVEFQRGSLEVTELDPSDAFKTNDADDSRSTVNFAAGLTGKGVKMGDSIVITFKYSGSDPKVKSAWWTSGNTLTPTGNHPKGGTGTGDYIPDGELGSTDILMAWSGGRAAGDGFYLVMIDAQPREFNTFPGDTAETVSARFAQFIGEWEFGGVLVEAPGMVQCTGYSYFSDLPNIQVEVLQQDSELPLFMDELNGMQLEVNNLVAGQKAEFTITDHHEGMVVAIVYSLRAGYTGVNGVAGYCGSLGLAGVKPTNLIGQGPIVGGQYTKFLPIPPGVGGLELMTQGILRDTCPWSVESNVVSRVIQK